MIARLGRPHGSKQQEILPLHSPSPNRQSTHWTGATPSNLFRSAVRVTAPRSRLMNALPLAASNIVTASRFRSHIVMERLSLRHRRLQVLLATASRIVADLRSSAYPHLAEVANQWAEALGENVPRYPRDPCSFPELATKRGRRGPHRLCFTTRPVRYNCLHPDLYGEVSFPLQMVFLLASARPRLGRRRNLFSSSSNRVRSPSRRSSLPDQGQAIIFPHATGP